MATYTHTVIPADGDRITNENGDLVVPDRAVCAKTVTYDLERKMDGARILKTSEFGQAIIKHM